MPRSGPENAKIISIENQLSKKEYILKDIFKNYLPSTTVP
jgi:hypothetical protein